MKPNLILRLWGWLTFAHIYPILKLGKTRPLAHADLSSLNADVNVDDLYDQFLETFHKEKVAWKSFYLLFRGKFWLSIGLYIFSPLALFLIPIVVGKLVSTVSRDPNDAPNGSPELRWVWAVLIFLTQIVSLSAESMSARVIECAALRARTIMNVAVFRMSITDHAHHLVSVERLNLMTQDSQRVVEFAAIMIRCLTAPLQLVAGIIYAYVLVGWPVLVGVAFMVLFVPFGAWMARMSYVISKRKMKATDVRVGYVDEILQAIKVLKSNAWEDACLDEVERRRRVELRQLLFFKLLESLFVPVSVMMPPLATVSVFLTLSFHSADEIFVASTVFQVVAIFTTFRGPFLVLPVGISLGSQVFTSLNRFEVFLSTQPKRASVAASVLSQDVTTYTWEAVDEAEERIPFCLIIPKCDIVPGSLLAVVGPLGSGKTAFLKMLLGEMTPSVAIDQTIAYCAQSPFIRHTTLQGNILGEEEFDSKRYDDVIKRCQLESDFDQLPLGDETEIGERGLNLSGGQKARVAIARAVYSRCDMLLFDDVLAALDSAVASSIITDVLMRETRTRIVVSVNMDVAKAADQVLFIADGTALPPATYYELLASSDAFRAFAKLSDPATWCTNNAQDKHEEKRVIKEQVIPFDSLCGSSQKSINFIGPERMCRGTVPFAAYKTYFASGAYSNSLVLLFLAMTFILAEASGMAMDLWLAQWTDDVMKIGSDSPRYIEIYAAIALGYFVLQLARSMLFTLFGYRVAVVLHNQLMRGVMKSPLRFFDETPSGRILNRASNDVSGVDFQLTNKWYVLILTSLRVLSVLVVMSISAPIFVAVVLPLMAVHYLILNFYRHSSRESQRLENTSRSPVVSAFTEVVHGLSTIRAYKWERSMVKQFETLLESNTRAQYVVRMVELWSMQRLMFVGAIIVLAGSLSIAVTYESISQGLAGAALAGSLTFLQNVSFSARYFAKMEAQMSSVERIMEYAALPPEKDIMLTGSASMLGTMKLEKKKGSCKCKAHTVINDVPFEPPCGAISFIDITITYRHGLPPALHHLSVDISAGSLVGICGRTGAGKSTLFLALLRLVPWKGMITIDGEDIRRTALKKLRRAITSVPQDPVLFSGTLRHNVDVRGEHSDKSIWNALERAHFKAFLDARHMDLDTKVTTLGCNWSAGEKQMICFARAMLQRNKILLLDEATSAMDGVADGLIQATLRSALKHTTRLVIAHRLQTIRDADQVLVIDNGVLVRTGGADIVAEMMGTVDRPNDVPSAA